MSKARNIPPLRGLYNREELEFVAEAAAKKAIGTVEAMHRREEKAFDPVQSAKRMLMSYRRLKIAQKEDIHISEAEGAELRWRYLIDLMGAPDRRVITEDAVYTREKKLQYNQYKIQRIEAAVEMYQKECENAASDAAMRRYRVVRLAYMDEKEHTVQEIAAVENVSDKAVYKDLGIAHKALADYLSAL